VDQKALWCVVCVKEKHNSVNSITKYWRPTTVLLTCYLNTIIQTLF